MPVCKNLFWRGYGARAFTPMLFAAFAINFAQAEDMKDMGDMKGMDHSQMKGMDHMQHSEPTSKDKDSKKAKTPTMATLILTKCSLGAAVENRQYY